MRKKILSVAAALALSLPLAVSAGTTASATPSSCSWGPYSARGSYASCLQGTGAYRSWTQCRSWTGFWYMRYGNWTVANNLSTSSCSWGDTRYSYGIQFG